MQCQKPGVMQSSSGWSSPHGHSKSKNNNEINKLERSFTEPGMASGVPTAREHKVLHIDCRFGLYEGDLIH